MRGSSRSPPSWRDAIDSGPCCKDVLVTGTECSSQGVINGIFPGFYIPHPPGRNDFKVRIKSLYGKLESYLVITLSCSAVGTATAPSFSAISTRRFAITGRARMFPADISLRIRRQLLIQEKQNLQQILFQIFNVYLAGPAFDCLFLNRFQLSPWPTSAAIAITS